MPHLGLHLSRKRLDVCALNEVGYTLVVTTFRPISTGFVSSRRRWRSSVDE